MLFGPGSLGIAFCRRPRVIYRAVSARGPLPCLRPYFSSSNYTLLKRWKNLKSPLKRGRFSSFALCRCYTLFISLTPSLLLSLPFASSRALSIVSRDVSRDIIPTGSFSLFPLLPLLRPSLFRSLPSVSTEIARHLGKQGSKQGISNEAFSRYFFFRHSNCF